MEKKTLNYAEAMKWMVEHGRLDLEDLIEMNHRVREQGRISMEEFQEADRVLTEVRMKK